VAGMSWLRIAADSFGIRARQGHPPRGGGAGSRKRQSTPTLRGLAQFRKASKDRESRVIEVGFDRTRRVRVGSRP
jgi:hypothetical protein